MTHASPANILVIEDDARISEMLFKGLSEAGYIVETRANGNDGLLAARSGSFDLLVVDVMLPGQDGLAITSALRDANQKTPILILSAKRSVDERVEGINQGADDYLTKPFAFSELLARCQALLRRTNSQPIESKLVYNDITVDLLTRDVRRNGVSVELLPKEFTLLEYLLRHSDKVVSKSEILSAVWKYEFDPQTNVVDVLVCRLRNKLDSGFREKSIRTVRGIGYTLSDT